MAVLPISYAGMNESKLRELDRTIEDAISSGTIPGAVLHLESRGASYRKAYGNRMTKPSEEPMTEDTIFDVASLTKVLATTPAILALLDEGKLSLDAPVSRFIPEFLEGGVLEESRAPSSLPDEEKERYPSPDDRETITIRHLLTHQSGLPPGIFLSKGDFWGNAEGARRAAVIGLKEKPGTRFRYSDVNYILLGEIVRRVSGLPLEEFVRERLFTPLDMDDTGYLPDASEQVRIAPTEFIEEFGLLRGMVHDPTARRMQGVAGHAGLFSTAEDIATFLRSWIDAGKTNFPLLEETRKLATGNQLPQALGVKRGLGWDIESAFAYQRGERFPRDGFGHTGWTGTSVWVDPASETFVVLLTNRNHPDESTRVKKLRIRIGTLAGEAVGYSKPVPLSDAATGDPASAVRTAAGGDLVLNGIDSLAKDDFAPLAGRRIGLITNHTGIARNRRSTIDLLAGAENLDLVALFSPEHGIRGTLETNSIDDGRDAATGLPVYSLYKSDARRPTGDQLDGIDTLAFDIQDIGCRFYTYISTMGLAMEAAAEHGKDFVVFDRVNPIGGQIVDGPIRTGDGNNFTAFHEIPVQHGMTTGELARMFREERGLDLDLTVIPVDGWNPAMRFDETGLPWVNPSPNMRSVPAALLYPGIGLLEFTNLSVGRGTPTPFEHVGAPWINEGKLAKRLTRLGLPGVVILSTRFTPEASVYEGEDCGGVRFLITDRESFRAIDLGIALGREIQELYPRTFTLEEKGNVLLRHPATLEGMLAGDALDAIRLTWEPEAANFLQRRQKFLLYPR